MGNFTIGIHESACIQCGRCVKVCPANIFAAVNLSGIEKITVSEIENCIQCGHCVGACPVAAVQHSGFPASKVHKIDYSQYPSPEQMELICRARRSNRAFGEKPVPSEFLNRILEAAHRAPTASNQQQVEFVLVTNKEVLHEISAYTLDIFTKIEKKLTNPLLKPVLKMAIPSVYKYLSKFRFMREEFAKGNDMVLRKAAAVIFIYTPKESKFGRDDANLAYQNGSLMAESMGVSQFYTGFVCTAIRQDRDHKLEQKLGINGTIHAGMALGMPEFRYPNYIDRDELRVKMIL